MKQYTTQQQTAKLIELGLPRPRCLHDGVLAYNIGELIEMLPGVLAPSNNDEWEMPLSISTDSFMWTVEYDGGHFSPYEAASVELIDALYDMVVRLKADGVYNN